MSQNKTIAQIAGNGRLSIPAKQRRELRLEAGGKVVLELVDGRLVVSPIRKVLRDIQDEVAKYLPPGSSPPGGGSPPVGSMVDDFLAEKREEVRREEERYG